MSWRWVALRGDFKKNEVPPNVEEALDEHSVGTVGAMVRLRISVLLVLCLPVLTCGRESEWTDLHRGASECVVAVFVPGTTDIEMHEFLKQHTQGPAHPGGGYALRSGVGSLVLKKVADQLAYEICFSREARPGEKAAIMTSMKNSPVVARLLEVPK